VRAVPYGEADVVATFFSEAEGLVVAMARGVRRMRKGVSVPLEPMHTLVLDLWERPRQALMRLSGVSVARPRIRLVADLGRLEVAGRALRWVRETAPPRTPEPQVWRELTGLLDALDRPALTEPCSALLAAAGLRLLRAAGYGLELERCVGCGRPCPAWQSSCIDPARGGLVCRACGGAAVVLTAETRARMRAALRGDRSGLVGADGEVVLGLIDQALRVHADVGV